MCNFTPPTAWQGDKQNQATLTICEIRLRYQLNYRLRMVLSWMNFLHSRVQVTYFQVLIVVVTLILPVQTEVQFFFKRVLIVLILIHRLRSKDLKLNHHRGHLNQDEGLIC